MAKVKIITAAEAAAQVPDGAVINTEGFVQAGLSAVSYTHLDVYKRQVYMGAESGSDKVLNAVKKNATQAEIIAAGQKLKAAGLKSSITLISGLGGIENLEEHAVESAKVISAIKPEYASLLTLLIEPGTPLHKQWKAGEFHPLEGPDAIFKEMTLFLQNIDSEGTVFRANHASCLLYTSRCV